jgi:hypothetical protein
MNKRPNAIQGLAALVLMALPFTGCAQVPVDEDGNAIGTYSSVAAEPERPVGNEEIPLLIDNELEELVGPIALYPDDLLAIVLPASAYPLQIIEAGRFLEALEDDASLEPDPDWDDSVVALLNYPEVVELLNDDIDWTWRLGEAVVAQQADVVAAVESFRDRAYAAGNLRSDEYQTVSRDEGVIEISPVSDDVIYVPYYEPERVVVYQPRPVYYYYPRAYPVYYYPYPSSYYFDRGYFWGVTTAFTIGWMSDSLHVYHHSYYGHPYYGRSYWDRYWYRRPSINVYNTTYVRNTRVTVNRYYGGDQWRPRRDRRDHIPATRPRTMSYTYQRDRQGIVERQLRRSVEPRGTVSRNTTTRGTQTRTVNSRSVNTRTTDARRAPARDPIRFRDRSGEPRTLERQPTTARSQSRVREPATRERAQPQVRQPTTRSQARVREPVVRERAESRPRQPASRSQPQVRQPTTRAQARDRAPVARERAQSQARQPTTRSQPQARQPTTRSQPQARQEERPAPQKKERSKDREARRESKDESRAESGRRRER